MKICINFSRYSLTKKEEFRDRLPLVTLRDSATIMNIVNEAENFKSQGRKGVAKRMLKEIGMEKRSPLWNLKYFSISFFKRFGICHLHLGFEGNEKRHLEYLIEKYPDVWKGRKSI